MGTETSDLRILGPGAPIVRQQFDPVSWVAGAGHVELTTSEAINMLVVRVDVIISDAGVAASTTDLTFADENGVAIIDATNFTTLAHKSNHYLSSLKAAPDFTRVPVNGKVTITVDPSAAPTAGSVLTVTVIFYGA